MPQRFKVVCIPCKALYKCSAFSIFGTDCTVFDISRSVSSISVTGQRSSRSSGQDQRHSSKTRVCLSASDWKAILLVLLYQVGLHNLQKWFVKYRYTKRHYSFVKLRFGCITYNGPFAPLYAIYQLRPCIWKVIAKITMRMTQTGSRHKSLEWWFREPILKYAFV